MGQAPALSGQNWPAIGLKQAIAALTAPGAPFEITNEVIDGQSWKVWKNSPSTMRTQLEAARRHGDRDFLVYEGERVSFEGFYRTVARLARFMRDAGVEKGDRVALVMRNLPEWPAVLYAGAVIGAIVAPLNAWWTADEIDYALGNCTPKLVVLDHERYVQLADEPLIRTPKMPVWVSRSNGAPLADGIVRLEDMIGAPPSWNAAEPVDLPAADLLPDDPVTLFYTSGTTGRSKGVIATHRSLLHNVMAGDYTACRALLRRGERLPSPDDPPVSRVFLLPVPFFHVTGCFCILSPNLSAGGTLVLMHKWNAVRAFELIEQEKVTLLSGVPTIAWQLIEHEDRTKYDLSSLKVISYGGAPASVDLPARIVETFPGVMPGFGSGMTETSGLVTQNSAEDYLNRPGSCGPILPVFDVEIRREDGSLAETGEVGELWTRGFAVAPRYWNAEEASAQTFQDGWIRTGDLAKLDEEGFLYIVDRLKDMLIRGGENIYCTEVENVLYSHPDVIDAALVGIPHQTLGEEPGAVVTLKPGAAVTEEELKALVRERLAAFKVPVQIVFMDDMLPRNPNGKILKPQLKTLFTPR